MGVYINTFRTEHKNASFDMKTVKVYAFRYLCRMDDADDSFGRKTRRTALLKSNMQKAGEKFDEIKPEYVALVHEDSWENATVVTGAKSGVNYDTEGIGETVVGFMHLIRRGGGRRFWSISSVRYGADHPMALGVRFRREYLERVVDGKIVRVNQKYRDEVDGVEFTEEQFQAWKTANEPWYLEACQRAADEQAKKDAAAAAVRQAKIAAKDAEITEAQNRLNQLRQERAAI
jgi:hypothetical protein